MHIIKNLTKQVVLLRFNSGAELNVGPEQIRENVPDSEIRNNAVIEKLKRLEMIRVSGAPARKASQETGVAAAAATDAEGTSKERGEAKKKRQP